MMTWTTVLLVALSVALIVLSIALLRVRSVWSRRSRRRVRRAMRGEHRARALLERHGYAVDGEQISTHWRITVDGAPLDLEVRADFLVRRDGRRLVAEVKTGALAPDPRHPPTRRQLLEYWLAYDTDGVLLVNAESGRIVEVGFPAIVDA